MVLSIRFCVSIRFCDSRISSETEVEAQKAGGAFICPQAFYRNKAQGPAQQPSSIYTFVQHSIWAGITLSGSVLDIFCIFLGGRITATNMVLAMRIRSHSPACPVLRLCATGTWAFGFQPHKLSLRFQRS